MLALSLLAPTTALAQGASSSADLFADAKDDRWPVGVAIAVRDSPYLGEVTRAIGRGDAYSPCFPVWPCALIRKMPRSGRLAVWWREWNSNPRMV